MLQMPCAPLMNSEQGAHGPQEHASRTHHTLCKAGASRALTCEPACFAGQVVATLVSCCLTQWPQAALAPLLAIMPCPRALRTVMFLHFHCTGSTPRGVGGTCSGWCASCLATLVSCDASWKTLLAKQNPSSCRTYPARLALEAQMAWWVPTSHQSLRVLLSA